MTISIHWSGGNSIGALYRLKKGDLTRVGHNWMAGRLKVGDVVMCLQQSGDCFYEYILIEMSATRVKGITKSKFGSYTFGTQIGVKVLEGRDFHLVAAGEQIQYIAGSKTK